MPTFALIFEDDPAKPVDADLRLVHRDYFLGLGERAIVGGPTFGEDGKVSGRLLVGDFPALADARNWAVNEPLVVAGSSKLLKATAMVVAQKDGQFTPVKG